MTGPSMHGVGSSSLPAAAVLVVERAREIAALPEADRPHEYRHLLRADVHDVVMRSTVDEPGAGPPELLELAAAVRSDIPSGIEEALNPRVAVFVRLLREDALDAAWMLANDNASGVVQPSRPQATWAGGSNLTNQLALPTLVDGDRVFAWLPGFRDPRWSVPDDAYDITSRVVLRSGLQVAELRAGVLQLSGEGYLGQLAAGPHDPVVLEFRGPQGARVEVPAVRTRRPDLVKSKGPDLTRIAWGGWTARVELARLGEQPGSWRAQLHVSQHGLHRQAQLGRKRGPLAAVDLADQTIDWQGTAYRLTADPATGALIVRAKPIPPLVRRAARRARRVVPRG